MSLININPTRRQTSTYEDKKLFGIEKVDNLSASELIKLSSEKAKDLANLMVKGSSTIPSTLVGSEVWLGLIESEGTNTINSLQVDFYKDDNSVASFYLSFGYNNGKLTYLLEVSPNITALKNSYVSLKTKNGKILCGIYNNEYNPQDYNKLGINLHRWSENTKILEDSLLGQDLSYIFGADDIEVGRISLSRSISSYQTAISSSEIFDENGIQVNLRESYLKEDFNSLDVPTINGEPLLFNKDTRIDNVKGAGRHLTVTAKHPGSDLENAGEHEWEVIKNPVKASITRETTGEHKTSTDSEIINDREEGYGLVRLSTFGQLLEPGETAAWTNLIEWLNTLGQDTDVVSVGLFKNFALYLANLEYLNAAETPEDHVVYNLNFRNPGDEFIMSDYGGLTKNIELISTKEYWEKETTVEGTVKFNREELVSTAEIIYTEEPEEDWITITETADNKYSLRIEPNLTQTTRTAKIEFIQTTDDGEEKKIRVKISQTGFFVRYLIISDNTPYSKTFPYRLDQDTAEEATGTIQFYPAQTTASGDTEPLVGITTKIKVEELTDAWLSADIETEEEIITGKLNCTLTYSIAENKTIEKRKANIFVMVYNGTNLLESIPIQITQESILGHIIVDPEYLDFNKQGESKTVNVSSNYPWSSKTNESWITLTEIHTEEGTQKLTISCGPNNSGSTRKGIVTIYNTIEQEVQVNVSQVYKTNFLDINDFEGSDIFLSLTDTLKSAIIRFKTDTEWVIDHIPYWLEVHNEDFENPHSYGRKNKNNKLYNESLELRLLSRYQSKKFLEKNKEDKTGTGDYETEISRSDYPMDFISFSYWKDNKLVQLRKIYIYTEDYIHSWIDDENYYVNPSNFFPFGAVSVPGKLESNKISFDVHCLADKIITDSILDDKEMEFPVLRCEDEDVSNIVFPDIKGISNLDPYVYTQAELDHYKNFGGIYYPNLNVGIGQNIVPCKFNIVADLDSTSEKTYFKFFYFPNIITVGESGSYAAEDVMVTPSKWLKVTDNQYEVLKWSGAYESGHKIKALDNIFEGFVVKLQNKFLEPSIVKKELNSASQTFDLNFTSVPKNSRLTVLNEEIPGWIEFSDKFDLYNKTKTITNSKITLKVKKNLTNEKRSFTLLYRTNNLPGSEKQLQIIQESSRSQEDQRSLVDINPVLFGLDHENPEGGETILGVVKEYNEHLSGSTNNPFFELDNSNRYTWELIGETYGAEIISREGKFILKTTNQQPETTETYKQYTLKLTNPGVIEQSFEKEITVYQAVTDTTLKRVLESFTVETNYPENKDLTQIGLYFKKQEKLYAVKNQEEIEITDYAYTTESEFFPEPELLKYTKLPEDWEINNPYNLIRTSPIISDNDLTVNYNEVTNTIYLTNIAADPNVLESEIYTKRLHRGLNNFDIKVNSKDPITVTSSITESTSFTVSENVINYKLINYTPANKFYNVNEVYEILKVENGTDDPIFIFILEDQSEITTEFIPTNINDQINTGSEKDVEIISNIDLHLVDDTFSSSPITINSLGMYGQNRTYMKTSDILDNITLGTNRLENNMEYPTRFETSIIKAEKDNFPHYSLKYDHSYDGYIADTTEFKNNKPVPFQPIRYNLENKNYGIEETVGLIEKPQTTTTIKEGIGYEENGYDQSNVENDSLLVINRSENEITIEKNSAGNFINTLNFYDNSKDLTIRICSPYGASITKVTQPASQYEDRIIIQRESQSGKLVDKEDCPDVIYQFGPYKIGTKTSIYPDYEGDVLTITPDKNSQEHFIGTAYVDYNYWKLNNGTLEQNKVTHQIGLKYKNSVSKTSKFINPKEQLKNNVVKDPYVIIRRVGNLTLDDQQDYTKKFTIMYNGFKDLTNVSDEQVNDKGEYVEKTNWTSIGSNIYTGNNKLDLLIKNTKNYSQLTGENIEIGSSIKILVDRTTDNINQPKTFNPQNARSMENLDIINNTNPKKGFENTKKQITITPASYEDIYRDGGKEKFDYYTIGTRLLMTGLARMETINLTEANTTTGLTKIDSIPVYSALPTPSLKVEQITGGLRPAVIYDTEINGQNQTENPQTMVFSEGNAKVILNVTLTLGTDYYARGGLGFVDEGAKFGTYLDDWRNLAYYSFTLGSNVISGSDVTLLANKNQNYVNIVGKTKEDIQTEIQNKETNTILMLGTRGTVADNKVHLRLFNITDTKPETRYVEEINGEGLKLNFKNNTEEQSFLKTDAENLNTVTIQLDLEDFINLSEPTEEDIQLGTFYAYFKDPLYEIMRTGKYQGATKSNPKEKLWNYSNGLAEFENTKNKPVTAYLGPTYYNETDIIFEYPLMYKIM